MSFISKSKGKPFHEAISHCRWKTILCNEVLTKPELQDLKQYANQTFDEIFLFVHSLCSPVKGIGMLTIYDITAEICRVNGILIDKVYIIGGGPERAVQLLHIVPKKRNIKRITLSYVEIADVLRAFKDIPLANPSNGDEIETFLCKWQKGV
jgi:hypothetical protein